VRHSSQIGALTLTGESSVGSGVRRLEAYVGMNALQHLATERALVAELSSIVKAPAGDLPERVSELVTRLREVEKELEKVRREQVAASAGSLTDAASDVAGVTYVGVHIAGGAPDDLRQMVTDTRARLGEDRPSVVALTGDGPGKPVVVVATNEAARAKGVKAGALVRVAAQVLGGGGGGKDDLAQGGGQDATKVEDALAAIERELGA
jgi:alanyl-tRNA synthetase